MLCLSGFELYSRWVPLFLVFNFNILTSFKLLLFLDMETPNSLHVKPSHSFISEDYNSMKTVGVKLSMWWRLN